MRAAIVARLGLALLLLLGAATVDAAEVAREIVLIPAESVGARVGTARMVTGVLRPSGQGPFPVLVWSHGRSGSADERARTRIPDLRGHLRYWLEKGFAVVAPIRPGYGETGGLDGEDSGVRYDVFGNCWGRPEFGRSAAAAADTVLAALAWVRTQPWADATHIVLAGVSMGGLASIASAATNPPGVVGYINFSGGTGGAGSRAPEHSCGSAQMQALMADYGRTTRVPSLWLYAENDLFWGPEWPRAWHRAYAAAGEPTQFVMTPPVPGVDGHQLLTRGGPLWHRYVDRFLAALDL